MPIRARTIPILSLVIFAAACSTKDQNATKDTPAMATTPAAATGAAMATPDSAGKMAGRGGMHVTPSIPRAHKIREFRDARLEL